ncbi:hypothetical protein Daus18300_013984 [Diaporthe australafricana]|uniref:Peptidase A1 domain-containing protein n=1 Tax=Diaporthe australafricana TaxID=127596 RepID=A0ABR3VX40_9PEZI
MHSTWAPSDSTTSKAIGDGFSLNYGTGSVKGALTEDSMSIASVKVTMTLGVANTTSDDFTSFAFDGILGLSMNKGASDNFMGSVKEDKLLKSNVFSVALDRAEDGPNTGELTFGGVDSSKFTGDITYTSVNAAANGDWAIAMDNIGYDGNKAGVTGRLAYIDTGTTYAFGPPKDVAALHKVIPGASSSDGVTFTAPCDSDKSVTVTFSGVDQKISAKDWLSEPSSSGVCTSNIFGREVVSGAWFLGAVYLKNVLCIQARDYVNFEIKIKHKHKHKHKQYRLNGHSKSVCKQHNRSSSRHGWTRNFARSNRCGGDRWCHDHVCGVIAQESFNIRNIHVTTVYCWRRCSNGTTVMKWGDASKQEPQTK